MKTRRRCLAYAKIRDEKDFVNHYHYTVYNHLKHILPENWKYTSLNCEKGGFYFPQNQL